MAALAVGFLWVSPARALPSFAGQTGLPCSACHVGAFGPQLTAFGIYFMATGYTQRGGTSPWASVPINIEDDAGPSFTSLATSRPKPPSQYYGTNNWLTPGCADVSLAAGYQFDGGFGVGGILKMWVNLDAAFTSHADYASQGPSDVRFTQPIKFGTHTAVLGFDVNNKPSQGDPYNTLYGNYVFPYTSGTNTIGTNASLMIARLDTSVYGLSLYAFIDNAVYVQAGVYETTNTAVLEALGKSPFEFAFGQISGAAPYFRLAYQHSWGPNFLEVGGVVLDTPLQQVPGVANPSLENQFVDFGVDATYQRTFGKDILAVSANAMHEYQSLNASFEAGKSSNPSDTLNQFRVAASYYWNNTYGFTLAYNLVYGSQDALLYPANPLSGSANGLPNSQSIIAQVDWTPWGKSTTDPGYPWANIRVGLQYVYYIEVNGGTTNYDGHGRNATDNNTFLAFLWWSL